MPKRSMVAIFGPELECVLFVAAPPLICPDDVLSVVMGYWGE